MRPMWGKGPNYIALIVALEQSPLYRAVRESVQIASIPLGKGNINRCGEWGAPRVPVLHVDGGGDRWMDGGMDPVPNPRPEWTREILSKMKEGQVKRICYWNESEVEVEVGVGDGTSGLDPNGQRPAKLARTGSQDLVPNLAPENETAKDKTKANVKLKKDEGPCHLS